MKHNEPYDEALDAVLADPHNATGEQFIERFARSHRLSNKAAWQIVQQALAEYLSEESQWRVDVDGCTAHCIAMTRRDLPRSRIYFPVVLIEKLLSLFFHSTQRDATPATQLH